MKGADNFVLACGDFRGLVFVFRWHVRYPRAQQAQRPACKSRAGRFQFILEPSCERLKGKYRMVTFRRESKRQCGSPLAEEANPRDRRGRRRVPPSTSPSRLMMSRSSARNSWREKASTNTRTEPFSICKLGPESASKLMPDCFGGTSGIE